MLQARGIGEIPCFHVGKTSVFLSFEYFPRPRTVTPDRYFRQRNAVEFVFLPCQYTSKQAGIPVSVYEVVVTGWLLAMHEGSHGIVGDEFTSVCHTGKQHGQEDYRHS